MNSRTVDALDVILEYRAGLQAVLAALPAEDIATFIGYVHEAYDRGKHIFVIGNGGSAATASHMACDLQKTVLGKQPAADARRLKVIALTDNAPLMTAWGNDVSYDTVFAEQVRNLANHGDLLIVITGSGNSPNIIETVKAARELGMQTIGLLGFAGGAVKGLVDHSVVVESESFGYIEDAHMIVTHLITEYFKQAVAESSATSAIHAIATDDS